MKLIYVHDPMCSWCWAFRPVWSQLLASVPASITVTRLLGGLAADTATPMAPSTREYVIANWRRIQETVPGIEFNFAFWTECQPRRATYPACRAVIAARTQASELEERMISAIQHAYYMHARNPSDEATLIDLAGEIGADTNAFATALRAPATQRDLEFEIAYCRRLGANSFPSLLLEVDGDVRRLTHNYVNAEPILMQLTDG